jgi:ribosomal protein L11 methyltransferase
VALIDAAADQVRLTEQAARAIGLAETPVSTSTIVQEQDWVRITQAQFDPIQISKRLWIVPTWHNIPDPEAIAIRLDPGLAFGTGSHPTTRMCLAWLDQHLAPADTVLDYGCGSGILAIAAVRLGARMVMATDLDAQACNATQDNAVLNQCSIAVHAPGQLPPDRCTVVIANILTNPLKVLAPALCARLVPGGRLTLSGILESQAEEVIACYSHLVALTVWRNQEGWVCLTGAKPRPS